MNTPIVLALVSLVFYGLGAFFNKVAAKNGVYFPLFLMIVNLVYVAMAVVIHAHERQPLNLTPRTIGIAILVGAFGAIGYACMFYAFQHGGEGSVVFPIVGLGILVSVSLSFIVFREPITPPRLLGLAMAAGSIVILSR